MQKITILLFATCALQLRSSWGRFTGESGTTPIEGVVKTISKKSDETLETLGVNGPVAPVSALSKPLTELQTLVAMNESANDTADEITTTTTIRPQSRNESSEGHCIYDTRRWRMDPQSAIANAVMFDRRSGISCEECLQNCIDHQDKNSLWICRSVTYDNRWRICDLYAILGTVRPQYLIVYPGRDYYEYLEEQKPSLFEQLMAQAPKKKVEKKLPPIRASGFPILPNTPMIPLGRKSLPIRKTAIMRGGTLKTGIKIPIEKLERREKKPLHQQLVTRKPVTPNNGESCADTELTRYAIIENVDRTEAVTEILHINTRNVEECARACDKDETFTCISGVVSSTGCQLYPIPVTHAIANEFKPAVHTTYLEKVCLQASYATNTDYLWPVVRNHVLVGHVLEVTDAETLDDCLMACLRAEKSYGFVCKSGMWYPADDEQNCLLNSEDRHTTPEAFVSEQSNVQMLYFDIPRDTKYNEDNSARRYKDEPLETDGRRLRYTKWTKCSKMGDGVSVRYLNCLDKRDIRKCPKETKPCGLAIRSLKYECVAVRDPLGIKRCPHGFRKLANGTKEYCRNPVDC